MKRWICLVSAGFLLAAVPTTAPGEHRSPPQQGKPPADPISVFRSLDGTWRGTFVGYDTRGQELYRIGVRQTYETVDAHTQTVTIRDEMPGGKTITGRGKNTAHRDAKGSLRLRCEVAKSNGERVVHQGRLVRGPDGGREIVWWSTKKGRAETFREWVTKRKGRRDVYHIHGMGRYGDTSMLMAGRYTRTK